MTQVQRIKAAVAASVALLIGVGIGVTGANANREQEHVPVVEDLGIWNAQQRADWCGGYVQADTTAAWVEGCTR